MDTRTTPPVRLQGMLVEQARVAGSVEHRSTEEQIKYWADIGRRIAQSISLTDLLKVRAGLMRLTMEKVESPPVDPDAVFAALDADRESGKLAAAIAKKSPIRYQASEKHPGFLEQVDESGNVIVGRFFDGEFHPAEEK